jgi:hypothetical protein
VRLKNQHLQGDPPQGDVKKAKFERVGCGPQNHWCYCPAAAGKEEGYACCAKNKGCDFDANGLCECKP